LNLVLSYGDLAAPGGYRTRVLGELAALDSQSDLDPFLLVFDRNPADCEKALAGGVAHRVVHRRAVARFYREISHIARRKPIKLIHAHNLYSAALALSCRGRNGYKVVLDYHGRIPEEYVFLGKGGAASRKALEILESWCVKSSDHVIAVSQKLSQYLIGRYRLPPSRLSIIPCCADSFLFRWDQAQRDAVRESLNVGQKFVCTHLGNFFEWYEPEMLIRVFNQIRDQVDGHLLVITSDRERTSEYLTARLPRHTFTVRPAPHNQVAGLLNASDIGFLLLRSSPNIETSSPVKFAEYINSGLPVFSTPGIGDFSDFIVKERIGGVCRQNGEIDLSLLREIQDRRSEVAARCAAAGKTLTWQAVLPVWQQMIDHLDLSDDPES